MSHSPEDVARYVCGDCQLVHAGIPRRTATGKRSFDAPETCGGCGGDELIPVQNWVHHHNGE
ncbi:hypothetical protein J2752_000229 [Halarchaeum rubridurum]|uniref:Small CPxCG-related zinc finger protein n=1 Tax=Halarchaeum rubridurum TaxID=489911 RepID=A0A830FS05_9EURY|nr:hypothetical protein [Halarchaeum rubridurum]MBP1953348.1 hypothetical protein [Halarchaeum rubridurum]GGM66014.1 hypothetical protein GCM10009017_15100 [Halarchaeum rubridurum]